MKYYTGVGSRSCSSEVIELIQKIGYKLAQDGYTLRSGAAEGADTAFEMGVIKYFNENFDYPAPASLAQIYIPWRSFVEIDEDFKDWYKVLSEQKTKLEAEEIASKIHPAWDKCSRGAKALHARNVYQVLGINLTTPSQFLIAYAQTDKEGKPKGGTRTSWMLAEQSYIPCFNLYIKEHRERIEKWLFK